MPQYYSFNQTVLLHQQLIRKQLKTTNPRHIAKLHSLTLDRVVHRRISLHGCSLWLWRGHHVHDLLLVERLLGCKRNHTIPVVEVVGCVDKARETVSCMLVRWHIPAADQLLVLLWLLLL
jgi:hypothetical protein